MSQWTESAKAKLEEYLARMRQSVVASGADVNEVTEDLRRHVAEEVAARKLAIVTEQDVAQILAQIGAPEAPAAADNAPPASPASVQPRERRCAPEDRGRGAAAPGCHTPDRNRRVRVSERRLRWRAVRSHPDRGACGAGDAGAAGEFGGLDRRVPGRSPLANRARLGQWVCDRHRVGLCLALPAGHAFCGDRDSGLRVWTGAPGSAVLTGFRPGAAAPPALRR